MIKEAVLAGLREEKKQDRRKRIAEAALGLFEKKGFDATTMEAIAEKAGLGVGTLYNYYPSKADLMLGIISGRAGPYEQDLKNIADRPPQRLADALRAFCDIYLSSFSFFSRRIWRDFVATALSRGLPLFDMIQAVDGVFLTLLTGLIGTYRSSAETSARNLYSVLLYNIMVFISSEDMDLSGLRKNLMRQVEVMSA
jgi:AcrR family transcriptional regulator